MVVNTQKINRLQAPLQLWSNKVKLYCLVYVRVRSCHATLGKTIRKRNNTSAMIHNKRPKRNGGRQQHFRSRTRLGFLC